jgi:putative nucleotidyltransferase with HDIG domain
MTGLVLTLVIVLSTTRDLGHFVVLMTVATAAVVPLSSIPARSKLIKVGFWTACVFFLVSLGTSIVQRATFTDAITDVDVLMRSSRGAAWCLAAGYLVAGSLPFIESTFGVVTDISLLEMSDVSHPLLQQLVARAPGTYNHSITVAAIGEAAADKIGANGLLVRVGAYFHDIGKMLKPHYFVENMTEGADSRHAHLAPAMSTLIIIGHVKDGVDLAHQHNLPKSLIDDRSRGVRVPLSRSEASDPRGRGADDRRRRRKRQPHAERADAPPHRNAGSRNRLEAAARRSVRRKLADVKRAPRDRRIRHLSRPHQIPRTADSVS